MPENTEPILLPPSEPTPEAQNTSEQKTLPAIGEKILGKINGKIVEMTVVAKDQEDPAGDETVALTFIDVDGSLKRGAFPIEVFKSEVQEKMKELLGTQEDLGRQAMEAEEISSPDIQQGELPLSGDRLHTSPLTVEEQQDPSTFAPASGRTYRRTVPRITEIQAQ